MGQDPDDLAASAQGNGSKSTPRLVGDRKPQYVQIDRDEVMDGFNFIAGSTMSKAQLRKRADEQLTRLMVEASKETRARSWIGDNGETLFSDETLEDYEKVKKRVYEMIDANYAEEPTDSTVSVTAEDADKAASIARGKRNQQRRDALMNRFKTFTDKFKGEERFEGAEFGPVKYENSSLLSSRK
jgi:hypothetical protein